MTTPSRTRSRFLRLQCRFKLLQQPSYSLYLAHIVTLFQKLKQHMRILRHSDDNDLKDAVQAWFEGCHETFPFCCNPCVEVKVNYVEN